MSAAASKWFRERKEWHKNIIHQRISAQRAIFDTEKFASAKSGREIIEKFIRPEFAEMLSDPTRKRLLLEVVLGLTFRARHPACSKEIDAAFEEYSQDTFDKYPATFNCIMTAMFYFYVPFCKKVLLNDKECKILGSGFSDQRSNLNDEKYVQSALLCARLATRDEGMRNIMELFKAYGLWNGQTVFIHPSKDVTTEIPMCLV